MANEISITVAASLANVNLTDTISSLTKRITQTNQEMLSKVVSVTTSEADLDTTGITTLGWLYIRNLDATNYIQYGPKSAGAMVAFGKLKAGEFAILRLMTGITLRWVANTATCKVHVKLYAE